MCEILLLLFYWLGNGTWEEPAEVSQLIAEFQFQLNIYCTEGKELHVYITWFLYTSQTAGLHYKLYHSVLGLLWGKADSLSVHLRISCTDRSYEPQDHTLD